jgi:energy-coupling factor transport system permease protein
MDLRAFGTGKRTWLRELRLDPTDRVVLLGFVGLFLVATIAGFTTGSSFLWVPPFLIPS